MNIHDKYISLKSAYYESDMPVCSMNDISESMMTRMARTANI